MDVPATLAARLSATGGRPLVVAHRGVWGPAPENALSAIRAARAFDMVEIDVQLSADGVPVLMHDTTLKRMTGRPGTPGDLPAEALAAIRLRAGAGGDTAPLAEERIPTLAEGLAAGGPNLLFDLDVKDASEIPAVARAIADDPARPRAMLKMDLAAPGDIAAIRGVAAAHGVSVIAKVMLRMASDVALLTAARDAGIPAAEVWFADLDILRAAVATGLPVTSYTLDDVHCAGLSDRRAATDPAAVWGTLRDIGLSAIMTDRAPELARFLEQA